MSFDPLEVAATPAEARLARRLLACALVVGLGLDGWLASRLALDALEARRVADRAAAMEAERVSLAPRLVRRRELEERRRVLLERQERLHALLGRRQIVSTKLARLGEIYAGQPHAWIGQLALRRREADGTRVLAARFELEGKDLLDVSRLRETLQRDPTFFAGFERIEIPRVDVTTDARGSRIEIDGKLVGSAP